jgi:hypothetical protein
MSCAAHLSSHQRRILRATMAREFQIVEQCNKIQHQMSGLMADLQCINHAHDLDERARKCDELIRTYANIDCDMTSYDMVPGAVQIAMTCDCVCIQATCFRVLYKWIPHLDMLRRKLMKIKKMCCESESGGGSVYETCTKIEKTVYKILKLKSASR